MPLLLEQRHAEDLLEESGDASRGGARRGRAPRGRRSVVEALADGELLLRRGAPRFESAFGALTGVFPRDYLARLDADDAER